MNNKIIELNNSFKNNKTIKLGYMIQQNINGKIKDIEFGKENHILDEIDQETMLENDLNIIKKELKNPNTINLVAKLRIDTLNFSLVIYIKYLVDNGEIYAPEITVFKSYLNDDIEIVLEKIVGQDTIYIPGFKEIYGEGGLEYSDFFYRIITFRDYSECKYQYNADGYISVNNGDKYPLELMNIDGMKSMPIDKENIVKLRSKQVMNEVYNSNILGMEIYITNLNHIGCPIIGLYNKSSDEAFSINIDNKRIKKSTEYNNKLNNTIVIELSNKFNVDKLEDNEYHITLDIDWIPDLIELQDGYGNHYTIERYQRLKIIK